MKVMVFNDFGMFVEEYNKDELEYRVKRAINWNNVFERVYCDRFDYGDYEMFTFSMSMWRCEVLINTISSNFNSFGEFAPIIRMLKQYVGEINFSQKIIDRIGEDILDNI